MRRFTIFISILFFSILSTTAHASLTYSINISGFLNRVDSPFNAVFRIGDPFQAQFAIKNPVFNDFDSYFQPGGGESANYYQGTGYSTGTAIIGPADRQYSVTNNDIRYQVTNDFTYRGSSGPIDAFGGYSHALDSDPEVGGSMEFGFRDNTATMFSNTDFPSTIPNSVPGSFRLYIPYDTNVAIIDGEIQNFSISAVPIPSTMILMGSALLGLGFLTKRKKPLAA